MPKHGDRTIERMTIVCPFCSMELNKWKLVPCVWIERRIKLRKVCEPEAIDLNSTIVFEQTVLQQHLDKSQCLSYISPSVLKLYGLSHSEIV